MSRRRRTLGIVGLGLLGGVLAEKAAETGFLVVGHDLDPEKTLAIKRFGAEPVDSAAEVTDRAKLIALSVLTTSQAVDVVRAFGDSLRPGSLVVDTSTGAPDEMVALSERLATKRVKYIDATIAGSSDEARRGRVLVLAGGESASIARARRFLEAFSRRTYHLGPVGAGSRMKLVFNLALGLNRAALAEALGFARAIGVDPAVALDVLKDGATYSRVMDLKGSKMLSGDYSPQARLDQHWKDVRIILELAENQGARAPLSRLHESLLRELVEAGLGGADNSAIIEAFR